MSTQLVVCVSKSPVMFLHRVLSGLTLPLKQETEQALHSDHVTAKLDATITCTHIINFKHARFLGVEMIKRSWMNVIKDSDSSALGKCCAMWLSGEKVPRWTSTACMELMRNSLIQPSSKWTHNSPESWGTCIYTIAGTSWLSNTGAIFPWQNLRAQWSQVSSDIKEGLTTEPGNPLSRAMCVSSIELSSQAESDASCVCLRRWLHSQYVIVQLIY